MVKPGGCLMSRFMLVCLAAAGLSLGVWADASAHPPSTVDTPPPAPVADHHDAPDAPPHDHPDPAPADPVDDHAHGPQSEAGHHQAADAADHHGDAETTDHHGDGESPGGHSHWGDHGPQTELEQTIANTGVLHPLAVHFPIALILAAALAQIMVLATDRPGLAQTVRFLIWTGALGGLAAGLLGWAHAGPVATGEDGVMSVHRWLGTGVMAGLLALAGIAEWHRRQPGTASALTLNVVLFAAAIAVSVNGFLGGALAHGGLMHLFNGS